MSMGTKTTTTKAAALTRMSRRSRPATSGNKNTNAVRSPVASPTSTLNGRLTAPIKGPDRGAG